MATGTATQIMASGSHRIQAAQIRIVGIEGELTKTIIEAAGVRRTAEDAVVEEEVIEEEVVEEEVVKVEILETSLAIHKPSCHGSTTHKTIKEKNSMSSPLKGFKRVLRLVSLVGESQP